MVKEKIVCMRKDGYHRKKKAFQKLHKMPYNPFRFSFLNESRIRFTKELEDVRQPGKKKNTKT